MSSVIRIQAQGKVKAATHQDVTRHPELTDLDTMIPLIQALIPLGLQAFAEVMQAEVAQLAGPKYSRTGGQPNCVRWGRQPGSTTGLARMSGISSIFSVARLVTFPR